ncbi:MAG: LysE/ArgO family amino acid transporter [Hyphomicrobiaceae bacterium]
MLEAGINGFAVGAGLIIAIGAQNVVVLTEGLRRRYVFTTASIGFVSDALLITAGVAGFGTVVAQTPALRLAAGWGGAIFLFVYGALAFRRAWQSETLDADTTLVDTPWSRIVLTMLAVTYLNPHVYLDTVLLLGALAGQYPAMQRPAFGGGAVLASCIWFYSLGYGARWLAPWFAKPAAWRVLDVLIGVIMWTITVALLRDLI